MFPLIFFRRLFLPNFGKFKEILGNFRKLCDILAALDSTLTTSKTRFSKLRGNFKKSPFFNFFLERSELAVLSASKQIVHFEKLAIALR
jgi:hypothetical protein